MAPKTGLGAQLYVDGYDLSGDSKSVERVGGGPATLDKTNITQGGVARRGGIRDGSIDYTTHFNTDPDHGHAVLSSLVLTDRHVMYAAGTVVGAVAAAEVAKQVNYDGNRSADGDFVLTVQAPSTEYGFEFGTLLTAGKRTDSAATDGASADFGAAHAFGLQAWLQVFAFTGTSATVKLQQSSDNGAGDAWTDVTDGGFASVTTGPSVQRILTADDQAVERYLRVVTTGTFSELVFAVMVTVNEATVTP